MTIAQVRKKVKDSGLRHNHIALKMGISNEYLSRILSGFSPLSESMKVKFKEFFKC